MKKIKISWKAFDLQSGFSKILLPDSTFSTNATGEFTVAQWEIIRLLFTTELETRENLV